MDHFGIKDGLSQNTVNCVLRDREGYYWFGTQDGLNRYDGYSVKVFRNDREDSNSVSDNFILQIVEDKWGNLWIGTRNGLNHYDKKLKRFTRVWMSEKENDDFHSSTRYLTVTNKGDILFSSGPVSYGSITNEDAQISPFKVNVHKEQFFCGYGKYSCISNGEMLSVYANGVLLKQVRTDRKGLHVARVPVTVWRDKIFLAGQGVSVIQKDQDTLEKIFPALGEKMVGVVYVDCKDRLWIGTNDGLYVVEDENKGPQLLAHNSEDRYSPGSNGVESIYEDRDGIMWIGTSEGGVNIYDPAKENFVHMNSLTHPALPSNMVWSVFQSGNDLYVGTNNGAVRILFENGDIGSSGNQIISSKVIPEKELGDKVVTNFAKDSEGKLWFGTRSHGVVVFDPLSKRWTHYTKEIAQVRQSVVSHLMCDRDGDMWISTQAGLYCWKKNSGEFEFHAPAYVKPGGLPAGYIFSTFQDQAGFIWIGSTNGLYKYDKNKKNYVFYHSKPGDPHSLSYNMPISIFEDSKGRLWICTLGGGIDLFDRKNEKFTAFTKKQGLANDVTYCIQEDSKGFLWISTNGGLSRFDPANQTFANFGLKEGVVSNEFTTNAVFKNSSGELFFGSPEGLVIFHPESLGIASREIPIVLTDLRVNYKSVLPSDRLDLHYSDKTITFEFAAIDWRQQDKISYAFKLDGFDTQWNEVSSSVRLASYSNLPFGDYIFRVRVKAENSAWQEKQFAFELHVIPPFWFRGWFILLEIVFSLSILWVTVKYYSQRKLKAQLREIEVQHKIQLERERISRDLHDNVGSNLTYIISSLDSIGDRIEKIPSTQAQVKIESLGEFTRSTMQQLRETIWVINKESVSIQELRDKINEHVFKMLSASGQMKFAVSALGNTAIKLTPSIAIHVFRVVQEAVNNSIKHSQAANLVVEIWEQNGNSLAVTIKDNGKGFELEKEVNGHYGLVNMQARTEEMGGKFKLSSETGKGTTVKLVIPV
jgi:signal transduction histidine kinase/sugar lactone lactonase YvrE